MILRTVLIIALVVVCSGSDVIDDATSSASGSVSSKSVSAGSPQDWIDTAQESRRLATESRINIRKNELCQRSCPAEGILGTTTRWRSCANSCLVCSSLMDNFVKLRGMKTRETEILALDFCASRFATQQQKSLCESMVYEVTRGLSMFLAHGMHVPQMNGAWTRMFTARKGGDEEDWMQRSLMLCSGNGCCADLGAEDATMTDNGETETKFLVSSNSMQVSVEKLEESSSDALCSVCRSVITAMGGLVTTVEMAYDGSWPAVKDAVMENCIADGNGESSCERMVSLAMENRGLREFLESMQNKGDESVIALKRDYSAGHYVDLLARVGCFSLGQCAVGKPQAPRLNGVDEAYEQGKAMMTEGKVWRDEFVTDVSKSVSNLQNILRSYRNGDFGKRKDVVSRIHTFGYKAYIDTRKLRQRLDQAMQSGLEDQHARSEFDLALDSLPSDDLNLIRDLTVSGNDGVVADKKSLATVSSLEGASPPRVPSIDDENFGDRLENEFPGDMVLKAALHNSPETLIAAGGGGEIYRAMLNGVDVVLKRPIVTMEDQYENCRQELRVNQILKDYMAETRLNKDIDAPFLKYYGHYIDVRKQSYVTLVFEYAPYSLAKLMEERRDEVVSNANLVQAILRQLTNGVHIMHAAGIMHRDIKLDNVLMRPIPSEVSLTPANIKVKIMDFDRSIILDKSEIEARFRGHASGFEPYPSRHNAQTTPDIMPPEATAMSLAGRFMQGVFFYDEEQPSVELGAGNSQCPFPMPLESVYDRFVDNFQSTSLHRVPGESRKDLLVRRIEAMQEKVPRKHLLKFDTWSLGVVGLQIATGDLFILDSLYRARSEYIERLSRVFRQGFVKNRDGKGEVCNADPCLCKEPGCALHSDCYLKMQYFITEFRASDSISPNHMGTFRGFLENWEVNWVDSDGNEVTKSMGDTIGEGVRFLNGLLEFSPRNRLDAHDAMHHVYITDAYDSFLSGGSGLVAFDQLAVGFSDTIPLKPLATCRTKWFETMDNQVHIHRCTMCQIAARIAMDLPPEDGSISLFKDRCRQDTRGLRNSGEFCESIAEELYEVERNVLYLQGAISSISPRTVGLACKRMECCSDVVRVDATCDQCRRIIPVMASYASEKQRPTDVDRVAENVCVDNAGGPAACILHVKALMNDRVTRNFVYDGWPRNVNCDLDRVELDTTNGVCASGPCTRGAVTFVSNPDEAASELLARTIEKARELESGLIWVQDRMKASILFETDGETDSPVPVESTVKRFASAMNHYEYLCMEFDRRLSIFAKELAMLSQAFGKVERQTSREISTLNDLNNDDGIVSSIWV